VPPLQSGWMSSSSAATSPPLAASLCAGAQRQDRDVKSLFVCLAGA